MAYEEYWKTHENVLNAMLGATGAAELDEVIEVLWDSYKPSPTQILCAYVQYEDDATAQTAMVRRDRDGKFRLVGAFDGLPWLDGHLIDIEVLFGLGRWPEHYRTALRLHLDPWTGQNLRGKITDEQRAAAEAYRPEAGEFCMVRVGDNLKEGKNSHGDGLWRVAEATAKGAWVFGDSSFVVAGSAPCRQIKTDWQWGAREMWRRGTKNSYNQLLAVAAQLEWHRVNRGASKKTETFDPKSITKDDQGYVILKHPGKGKGKGNALYSLGLVKVGAGDLVMLESEGCPIPPDKCELQHFVVKNDKEMEFKQEAAEKLYKKLGGAPYTKWRLMIEISKQAKAMERAEQKRVATEHKRKFGL